MSARNRRRKYNIDAEDEEALKQFEKFDAMFAEERAYKMECEDKIEEMGSSMTVRYDNPT